MLAENRTTNWPNAKKWSAWFQTWQKYPTNDIIYYLCYMTCYAMWWRMA